MLVDFCCEFEFRCATEGSRRGRNDKMTRCRSTFFLISPPAHLCADTNITKILLNVTLTYQIDQLTNQMVLPILRGMRIHTKHDGKQHFCFLLGLLLSIGRDGQLRTSLYDKRDDFNFHSLVATSHLRPPMAFDLTSHPIHQNLLLL